eukprot:TRINITY_DN71725_c0_g1_i1.p1 TRINITY_DN71725_c0_g1~~TRINITY_DN71725_c0_g1_i1.p1  ORF type:complete len:316 (+),score=36.41 TRINITY_DN71725_c0_g1_i1:326-1273(+)
MALFAPSLLMLFSLFLDSIRSETIGLMALQTSVRRSKGKVNMNDTMWHEDDETLETQEHLPTVLLIERPCSHSRVANMSGLPRSPAGIVGISSKVSNAVRTFFGLMKRETQEPDFGSAGVDSHMHFSDYRQSGGSSTATPPQGSLVLELQIRNTTLHDVFSSLGGLQKFLLQVRNTLSSCIGLHKRNIIMLGVFQRYQLSKRVDLSLQVLNNDSSQLDVVHTRVVVRFALSNKGEPDKDPQAALALLRRMLSKPESMLMQSKVGVLLSDAEISVGVSNSITHHSGGATSAMGFRPLTVVTAIAMVMIVCLTMYIK